MSFFQFNCGMRLQNHCLPCSVVMLPLILSPLPMNSVNKCTTCPMIALCTMAFPMTQISHLFEPSVQYSPFFFRRPTLINWM